MPERPDLCRPDPGAGGVEEGGRVDALEHGSLEYLREKREKGEADEAVAVTRH